MSHEINIILMVDDNPDFVELAKRAFRRNNIANPIVVAEDGQEALDYLFATGNWAGRDPVNPVVILLDLKLPKVDGLQVLARIREDQRTAQVPVVILSTSKEDKDIERGYKLGCNSYICKPVNFNNLAEALKQAGLYWLVLNQPPDPRWEK